MSKKAPDITITNSFTTPSKGGRDVSFAEGTIIGGEEAFRSDRTFKDDLDLVTPIKSVRLYDPEITNESLMIGASFAGKKKHNNYRADYVGSKMEDIIYDLQRRFYGILKQSRDIESAEEGVRGAARHLIEIIEDFSTDNLSVLPLIEGRTGYITMKAVEEKMQNIEDLIAKREVYLKTMLEKYETHRFRIVNGKVVTASDQTVEDDKKEIKKARARLNNAKALKEETQKHLAELLRENPSTSDQIIEHLVTNLGELSPMLPLYRAIQRFDWLALTMDPAVISDPLKTSRRIWLQHKILNEHFDQGVTEGKIAEFYEIKAVIKTTVRQLVKDTREEQNKTDLATEIADLMDRYIEKEATDLSGKRKEEREEQARKRELQMKESEIRAQNLKSLADRSEELIKAASQHSVAFVRNSAGTGSKKSKSLTTFNSKIEEYFQSSGVNWKTPTFTSEVSAEDRRKLEKLIQAYQVTKFLELKAAVADNVHNKEAKKNLKDVEEKIAVGEFQLDLLSIEIITFDELTHSKTDFQKLTTARFFTSKTQQTHSSVNNLAAIFLYSEALQNRQDKERRIIAQKLSQVTKKMQDVNAKHKKLSHYEHDDYSTEDPIRTVEAKYTEQNWLGEAATTVKGFYYNGRQENAATEIHEILKSKSFLQQDATLTEISRISDLVITEADRIILEEDAKIRSARLQLEQDELRRLREKEKLEAKIREETEKLKLQAEVTDKSLVDLAERINVLMKDGVTTDEIESYRASYFRETRLEISRDLVMFLVRQINQSGSMVTSKIRTESSESFRKRIQESIKDKLQRTCSTRLESENTSRGHANKMSKLEELAYSLGFYEEAFTISNEFDGHLLNTVIPSRNESERLRIEALQKEQSETAQREITNALELQAARNKSEVISAQKKQKMEDLLAERQYLWHAEYDDAIEREEQKISSFGEEIRKEHQLRNESQTDKDISKFKRDLWTVYMRHAVSSKKKIEKYKDFEEGIERNLGPYEMSNEQNLEIEELRNKISELEASKEQQKKSSITPIRSVEGIKPNSLRKEVRESREFSEFEAKRLFSEQDSERNIFIEKEEELERLKRQNQELLFELKQLRVEISTVDERIEANRKIGGQEIKDKEEQIRKLRIREEELSSQIKQSEASVNEANLSYVEIKKVAVKNLARISYRALEKVSEKEELLKRALGRNNNKIAEYFKGLATILDEEEAIYLFVDVYTKNNPEFLQDLEAIRKLTQQVLEVVDQEVQRKSEQQKKLELREQREKHDGIIEDKDKVLQDRERKLKWSEANRARVQLEKEQQEKSFTSEIDNANKHTNEKEAESEIASVQKWLYFASHQDVWTVQERIELQESIIKQAGEGSSLSTVLKKLFSSRTTGSAPVLAQTLLDQSSIEDQKRILSETKSIFETIIDNVRQSEAKKIKSYKENFVKLKNQLELETILRSAHELLVNDKDVKQTEVEEIIQEIQKRRRWDVDALFTGFHVKRSEPNFSVLVTEQLENLQNSAEQIERIDQAKQIISQIRDGISARKAEKEKAVSKKAIADHLQRTYSFLEDKNLTTEEKVELLSRKELISANQDKIKKAIGSLFRKTNFAQIANDVSDLLSAQDIEKLAEDIDIESRKIEQEAFTIILVKEGDKYRKLVDSERLDKENKILAQKKEFDQQIESEGALKAERVQEISNLKNKIATLKQEIEEKVSINEGETSELKRLKKNLTQKEKELSTANDLVDQEKNRANSAEIKLTSLDENLIELHERLKVLNSELEQEKEKAEREKEVIRKELKDANDNKNLQAKKILELENQISNLESRIGTNESEKDKLIKSLKIQLESAQESIVGRMQEIEKLQVLLQDFENKRAIEKQEAELLINQLQQQILQSNLDLQKSKEGYEERIQKLLLEIENVEAQKLLSDKEKTTALEKLQEELGLEKEKLKDANILLDQEKERANKSEAELTRIQNEVLPQLKQELEDAKSSISRQQQEILEFKNKISQVLEEIIRQKQDSDLLINSLKQEIASLKSKLSDGDLEKVEKIRKLEEDLRLALKNVEEKTAELELEKDKLKQSESEKAANLTKAISDQELLNARILEEQHKLELLKTKSQETIKSLQNRIDVFEQEKRDRGLGDGEKDVAITELKENLEREQKKLRELEVELKRLRHLEEYTEKESNTDEAPISREELDLPIDEMRDRFQEPNSNGRRGVGANWYTSAKIVVALNRINNIIKSFEGKAHSNPNWESIWKDDSLATVNDSNCTLTRGDKQVLTKFALQKADKYIPESSDEILRVVRVSKQLLRMVPDWKVFSSDLTGGLKKVGLAISTNPSTSANPSPSPSPKRDGAEYSLIRTR